MKETCTLLPYSILVCQINYLKQFIENFLPTLHVPIILLLTQYHICNSNELIEHYTLLEKHSLIHTVFAHNAVLATQKSFPYGINICNLQTFSKVYSVNFNPIEKRQVLGVTGINYDTHSCRKRLVKRPKQDYLSFLNTIASSQYILSPVGDRDDCFRHWECIGLGAIPITNANARVTETMGSYVLRVSTEELLQIDRGDEYTLPNSCAEEDMKKLILVSYYKFQFLDLQNSLRKNAPMNIVHDATIGRSLAVNEFRMLKID